MAGGNLSVKITADVVDAQTKFALMQAQASSLGSEMRKLAAASVGGIVDPAAADKLRQVAGDFATAKVRLAELRQELNATREVSGGLSGTLSGIGASLSTAFQVAGVTAAAAAVMKIGEAITTLGDRAIQIKTMGEVLGATTSQIQAMKVAADESGTSIEIFARASEKLTNYLTEARNGSGPAIEKLHEMGIATTDIANPTFQLNDVLAVLKTRLLDVNTAEATRKALLTDLGARTALAIAAIKSYDGSMQGVAEAMQKINGYSPEQIEHLKEARTWWSETGDRISNATGKVVAWTSSLLDAYKAQVLLHNPQLGLPPASPGAGAGPGGVSYITDIQKNAEQSARSQEALHNEVLQSDMASIKEGLAAFAEGSTERLNLLRKYAAEAKEYYGAANVTEVRKANSEVLAAERAYRNEQSSEAIAGTRQQIAEIGSLQEESALSRATQEHAIWEQELNDTRLTAKARIEVEREVATTTVAMHRAAAQEQATIDRQNVTTNMSISRLQIEAEKNNLQLGTAANAQAVADRLAQLRLLTATEFALNEQALENEMAALAQEPAAANRVYNEIRELKAKLVVDLQTLDKEAAEASKKYAQQQTKDWQAVVSEIEGAESGFVSDMLNRRKTLSQSLQQISADLVTKEISNDLRAITTRLLLENSAQTQQKALEQGGYLYHLLFQTQKTAATTTAQSAQTSAVISGQTAQNAALASGAAAGKAVQAATGPAQVMADAAEAYAGAFAATAAIPYIGPELAPAAGAEAYAAVAAMAGAASLDVGTNYVHRDMLAHIHQGEAVVPKKYNPAAGGEMPVGGGGDTHVHLNMSAFDASGMDRLVHSQSFRDAVSASANRHFNRGGRLG